MKYTFSKEIYNKEAILKAAYAYTDSAYFHIDANVTEYIVDIKEKGNKPIDLDEFQNEVLAQMVRMSVQQKTKNIRELILARSFSSTVIGQVPSYQAEKTSVDINDILTDWFEKYE